MGSHELPDRTNMVLVETDLLVVGAGPAGGSLGCFLARYGLKGIVISATPGTADTPRAHITNTAALECLRDIGLEDDCLKLGNRDIVTTHYRWCESMAGEEYARIYAWGNDPARKGDYDRASPCKIMDLPQTLLEPLLVKYATLNEFKVRFDTRLLSFTEDAASRKIISLVKDQITGAEYRIISKCLFGADGGKSVIANQLDLQQHVIPGGGLAHNVLVRADMAHLMEPRHGNLHWNVRLKRDYPFLGVGKMVKPWFEWLFVFFPKRPDLPNNDRTLEEWKEVVEDLIDDQTVSVEVLGVSKWNINETVAEEYSKGNVFCLGDAVHRHPPTGGLGSNTCIQDAFNLAWKINLVLKGLASPSLLSTYSSERQPVGAQVVKIANDSLRMHFRIWETLGVKPPGASLEERLAGITELKEDSEKGRVRRKNLREAVLDIHHETHALGTEMGQFYEGPAVYTADEPEPFKHIGKEAEDAILHYESLTYPGRKLPHVWLNTYVPGTRVSTIDIAGKGAFCLFTGVGGQPWRSAAGKVGKALGIPITVVSIGWGQDWTDPYNDWAMRRGIEEDGAILVRPDLFVAWRAQRCLKDEETCLQKLGTITKFILGLK